MTQRLTYRPAVAADLEWMLALVVEDNVRPTGDDPEHAPDPAYLAALAAIDADPHHELLIAELDGARVGTLQLSRIPGIPGRGLWRGQIENVHIASSHRNLGLGSEMIRWAIERLRAGGCGLVQLTSNKLRTDAHRFYERLGFQRSHEGFKLFL